MTKKYKKVPVRGITAEQVMKLWQEGRLYQEVEEEDLSDEELLARCRQEVLAYVEAIDEYACEFVRPYIGKVWRVIVEDDAFADGIVMKQKRKMNRYFVTNVVFNLQTRGIYLPAGQVCPLQLHLRLERTTQKNSVYKNIVNYPLTALQRKHLSKLIEDFVVSLKISV